MLLKSALVPLLTAAMLSPVFAGKTIELWYDGGGAVYHYADRARLWKKRGDRIVIRDVQASAAALGILYAKQLGVRVCHGPSRFNARPVLYAHQTRFQHGGRWHYVDQFKDFGFQSPINGYRKISMKEAGIPPCRTYKADERLKPKPQIWRLR
jgi:hypothetical protein